jgi:hypothetical protein
MTLTLKVLNLKKKVENYPLKSFSWLYTSIQNTTNKFNRVFDKSSFISGKFYFLRYDLKRLNKTQKLEQLSPILLIDSRVYEGKKYYYGINLNFFPLSIKEAFFTKFIDDNYTNILKENEEKKTVLSESPLSNINYDSIHLELLKYGYEYTIREYRDELINEIYMVSTDFLDKFITIHTQTLTGVDDTKLNEIWIAKLKAETLQDRLDDVFLIKSNYENILKELKEKFKNLEQELSNI